MKILFKSILLCVFIIRLSAQEAYQTATVAFYNVENLFDTIRSIDYIDGTLSPKDPNFHRSIPADGEQAQNVPPYKGRYSDEIFVRKKIQALRRQILSDEFTPEGPKGWNGERYENKLKQLSGVLSEVGTDLTQSPPAVIGLVEVENRKVLEDLVRQPLLQAYDYGVIHRNSYDERGIDCALIYQKGRFVPKDFRVHTVKIYDRDTNNRDYTRDILSVEGELDGETVHFIVNHWPSRRGGEDVSAPKREEAARVLDAVVKEIQATRSDAKIIIMGDFNDEATGAPIQTVLNVHYTKEKLRKGDLYNPMRSVCRKGGGTYAYKKQWSCIDQFMMTTSVAKKPKGGCASYCLYKVGVFNRPYLTVSKGAYKGYPFRTFDGNRYLGGYSDHFPIYTVLVRKKAEREGR